MMTSQPDLIINLIAIPDIKKIDVGTYASAPIHYFSFKPARMVLQQLDSFDQYSCPRSSHLIIGGGTLLGGKELKPEEQTEEYINKMADIFVNQRNPKYFAEYRAKKILKLFKYFTGRKILWGVGDLTDQHFKISIYRQIYLKADLIGLRNYPPGTINLEGDLSQNQKIFYIPDVSCCDDSFDKCNSREKLNSYDLYIGRSKEKWKKMDQKVSKKDHSRYFDLRNTNLKDAISQIVDAKTIYTNSYQPYYWAHLLKKNVILDVNESQKELLKFKLFNKDITLEKARELNKHFHKKIMYLLTKN